MPTAYTLTGDIGDLLGSTTVVPTAEARLETNLRAEDALVHAATGGTVRLGGLEVPLNTDGTFTVAGLVGSDSTDLNVAPGVLQYRLVVKYRNPATGREQTWRDDWFHLNGNADIATVAKAISPEVAETGADIIAQAEAARDQASEIAGLTGEDAAVAFLVDNPSDTQTALDGRYASAVEIDAEIDSRREVPSGLAGLDSTGLIYQARIPDMSDIYASATALNDRLTIDEAPLSPYRYGFVGDGVADDTAALQATLDAVPATGGEVALPHTSNAKLAGKVTVSKPVTLRGKGQHQRLVCSADGIEIAAGINDVHLADFDLLAATRYTTTPHTFAGVKVLGTSAARNNRLRFDNLRIDGFERALDLSYVWASDFSRITTAECFRQVDVYGLSVNNSLTRCNLSAARIASSTGLRFRGQVSAADSTAETAEGWRIADNLIFGAKENIDLRGVRYFVIANNIIDWSQGVGIWLRDNGTHYSGAHRIVNNYIAVGGSSGQGGIRNDNNIAKNDLDVVQGNLFNAYAATDPVTGLACTAVAGVWADDPHSAMIIEGNTSRGFATNDIRLLSSGSIVRGNNCTSSVTNQINPAAGTLNLVDGNNGTVFRAATGDPTAYRVGPMGKREYVWTGPPAGSAREVGERVVNAVPGVGAPKGWVCTAAGSPGTWVSEGNL